MPLFCLICEVFYFMKVVSTPNYPLKAFIFTACPDLLKKVNNACFNNYCAYALETYGEIIKPKFSPYKAIDSSIDLQRLYELEGYDLVNECVKINNANYHRKDRLKERITKIYFDSIKRDATCYFITFDFCDDTLEKTSELTRRRYIQRWLKQHCFHYVANIDYGKDDKYTNREHYHCFCSSTQYANMIHDWHELTNSGINIKKLRIENDMNESYQKLSTYIAKLTNHAIKDSVKRNVYIYDRNTDYLI